MRYTHTQVNRQASVARIFKPIHKFFKITISSKRYEKDINSDIVSLHVYKNTPNKKHYP